MGRKALVIISDGVDVGSIVSLQDAVEAAQRADLIIYSVLYSDGQGYSAFGGRRGGGMGRGRGGRGGGGGGGGRPPRPNRQPVDGKAILQHLSAQTGGSLFEVKKKKSLEQIFEQIQQELRHQYSIGFRPQQASSAGEFRSITLKTTQKGLTVHCRAGYYPKAEWVRSPRSKVKEASGGGIRAVGATE